VCDHNFREAPWDEFHGLVDGLIASYDLPERPRVLVEAAHTGKTFL
jgi:hypothetical protein